MQRWLYTLQNDFKMEVVPIFFSFFFFFDNKTPEESSSDDLGSGLTSPLDRWRSERHGAEKRAVGYRSYDPTAFDGAVKTGRIQLAQVD